MLIHQCACNEEGREEGDDVGLEALHHKFEEGHRNTKSKGEGREDLHEEMIVMEHVVAAADEDEQEQVTGEHIGKETQ